MSGERHQDEEGLLPTGTDGDSVPSRSDSDAVEDSRTVHVAFAADRAYVRQLAVGILSLVKHLSTEWKLHVYVLEGELSRRDKAFVAEAIPSNRGQITWLRPDLNEVKGLRVSRWISEAAYYRLLYPKVLPEKLTRIIHLDSDVVVQRDLSELWTQDMGPHHVLAAWNLGPYFLDELPCAHLLDAHSHSRYFNSGVMVINLAEWRVHNISDQVIRILRENPDEMPFWDQDALNICLKDKWGSLDLRWNQQSAIFSNKCRHVPETTRQAVITDPCIVHFTAPLKPWEGKWKHPRGDLFFHYLDQTHWKGWRPRTSLLARLSALVKRCCRRIT
jgi:lipopolysaccharide biosynthesis glycosyltransferase